MNRVINRVRPSWRWSLYDEALGVPAEDLEVLLRDHRAVPWADFVLNPRRLRGSDFLMRWSQGVWSERRIKQMVNETGRFVAIAYGPSSTAPEDPRAHELYFERLEAAGLGEAKRPDVLVYRASDRTKIESFITSLGGEEELPFIPENRLEVLLKWAVVAIESENSLWIARQMPHFNSQLRPQRRLGGRLGLPKGAVVPTVIVKDAD